MNETFVQGLIISAIGMGMVFAALAALWGLIALLARLKLPSRQPRGSAAVAELNQSKLELAPTDDELTAIAAALALLHAEEEAEAGLKWRLPPLLTRWVAVGYGRQLISWQPPRGRRGNS
jgi:Na+-transporting methylmalonyl-CoA/oxaloacetate decarboxylase gamma subunit